MKRLILVLILAMSTTHVVAQTCDEIMEYVKNNA